MIGYDSLAGGDAACVWACGRECRSCEGGGARAEQGGGGVGAVTKRAEDMCHEGVNAQRECMQRCYNVMEKDQ